VTRRTLVARFALIAAALLGLVLASASLAAQGGRPGGHGDSSISLVILNGATEVHLGGQVTFSVTTTETTAPWVNVNCYQNGALVYSQWHGFYPEYLWDPVFNVGPTPSWQGGEADCVAQLIKLRSNGRESTLATTSFHVYE
jgi:hypothetical protein